MTTVIDVARIAGVSAATVSRVLSGNGQVSAKMRARVLAVVHELDFRLNPMAQGLRRGHNATVALLVGDIEQNHFSATTKNVQAALTGIGLDLLLYNLDHSENRLCEILDRAVGMHLRGVIIASSDKIPMRAARPLITNLERRGVAIICLGQRLERTGIPSVAHDERTAARRSVEYLIGLGRRKIAYVGRVKGSVIGTQRVMGYKDALRAAGMNVDESLIWDVSFRYSAGREAVITALKVGIHIDGLQAGSDELALGAISAFQDHKIQVPQEVSVIGFGDIVWSDYLRPALTTLSSHPEIEAQSIINIFNCLDKGEPVPSITLIDRHLIRRQSA